LLTAPTNDEFDAKAFLAKVGTGKTILEFHKGEHVFEQGDVADTVFYIQKGKVKLTVLSEQGKEAVVAILEPGQFFGEGCMNGHKLRIFDDNRDGGLPDHVDHEIRDGHRSS
jgi:CRP/FNR family transcriptional regulator, cyclic AMP receptor protein